MSATSAGQPRHSRSPGLLVIALLVPVSMVAVLASVALVRDWRDAQREAVAKAQEIASAAAERLMGSLAIPQFREITSDPSASEIPAETEAFLLDDGHQLIWPPPGSWPPQPQPLPDGLPAVQQELWETACAAFIAGEWSAAVTLYDQFLGAASNGDADAASGAPAASEHSRYLALARLEKAIAMEHCGATAGELAEAFHEVLDGLMGVSGEPASEAGIPIAHLAAMRILEIAKGDPKGLPRVWRQDPERITQLLARSSPSPFLDEIFKRLRPILEVLAVENPGVSQEKFLRGYYHTQRCRERYQQAIAQLSIEGSWPEAFWVNDASDEWLAVRQSSVPAPPEAASRRQWYAAIPLATVTNALGSVLRDLDPHGDFALNCRIANRELIVSSEDTASGTSKDASSATPREPLAHVTGNAGFAVAIAVALLNPQAYYAAQRGRLMWFGGLLVTALGATLVAVVATRRALLRQYELNLQKSNFVSAVSHELRAPLGSIRLLAEGLERGTVTDEGRRKEYIRLIGQETRRLGALIGNVLDFSRIEQGRARYEFEPTDIAALVRETIASLQPLAESREVALQWSTPLLDEPIELLADGRALQQALVNLVDNALKHSPAGSVVSVEWTTAPSRGGEDGESVSNPREVRITVADSGPGVPEQERSRIFEPFYRLGSELRRETPGVGIGLTIVKHIVAAHGGRVEVASNGDTGARFVMTLPIHHEDEKPDCSARSA